MSVRTDNVNVNVNINGEKSATSLREMRKNVRELRNELSHLAPGTDAFNQKMKELQKHEAQLKKIQNEIKGVGGWFSKISQEVKQFGILAAGYLGFQFITDSVNNIIKKNAALSDELADIQKTTGMTEAEVKRLNQTLSQVDTRTSTSELRKIAAAAGQLGIAKEDIVGFTVATDKLVVALGDEFQGGAEEVTKNLGALRNIFSDVKSDKVDEDMMRIGNALNELGAAGAATAPVVSDFANRIGGVGIPLGLTSGQVLALSATMQELNISTERGGTAMVKILQRMASHTEEFAQVAGMNVEEFSTLVDTDLYGAFLKVVEGSQKTGDSATALSGILDSLGVDGSGASEVFMKLGTNTEMLEQKLQLSNKALKETSSITAEFNTKNETFGAKMEKLGKAISGAFVNSGIKEAMSGIVDTLTDWMKIPLSEKMEDERMQLQMTKLELLSTNTSQEDRVKLIKELQQQYPDYLSNINAETVSNSELTKALEKVNDQLINKIILQKQDEKIQEQNEQLADARMAYISAEEAVLKATIKASEEYNIKLKEGLTIQEQGAYVMAEVVRLNSGNQLAAASYGELALALNRYEAAGSGVILNTFKTNALLSEKEQLMQRLGMNIDTNTDKTNANTDANKAAADAAAKAAKAEADRAAAEAARLKAQEDALRRLKALREQIAQIEEEQYQASLSRDEREIRQVELKYAKLLEQAKGFKDETLRLEQLKENELAELRKTQNERLLKEEQDKQAKRTEIQEKVWMLAQSQREQELIAEMQKWDKIHEEAAAAGVDSSMLYEQQAAAIQAIIDKWNQKEIDENQKKNDELLRQNRELYEQRMRFIDDTAQSARYLYDIYAGLFQLMGDESEHAAEFQKRLAIFQIAVDTASAISKAVATGSAVGLTPVEKTLAILGNIAVVVANMNKAKEVLSGAGAVPQYEYGGIAQGSRHYQGGIAMVDNRTGKQVGEMEEGEPILSRATYANNKGIVDALLYSSKFQGGKRVFDYTPRMINYTATTTAIRAERAAVFSSPTASTTTSQTSAAVSNSTDTAAILKQTQVMEALLNVLQNGVEARLNYNNYTRDLDYVDRAKKSAQIG